MAQFNQIMNMCLRNEVALLNKQEQNSELQFRLQQNTLMQKRIKETIAKIEKQVEDLNTNKKITVLNRFKELMQRQIQNYDESYDSSVRNFETFQQGQWTKINDIRKKQSVALYRRSQAVPQDTQSALLVNQCQQAEHAFNLFQQHQQNNQTMGIPSTVTGSATQ